MKRLLSVIFTISLMAFMILGIGIVLIQVFSLLMMNGALSVWVTGMPKKIVILLSALAGFSGFIYSYIREDNQNAEK